MTKWIIKIKLNHANFLENFDRISEYSSKWILIFGILSENTKANYTERYDSLLKMKNHVKVYIVQISKYIWQNTNLGAIEMQISAFASEFYVNWERFEQPI